MTNSETDLPSSQPGTRQAILSVAFGEFARKGFAGARVDAICKVANVQRQTLYYHFASKDELYAEVLSTGYRKLFFGLDPLIDSGQFDLMLPADALRLFVQKIFDCLVSAKDVISIVADANKHYGPELPKLPVIGETAEKYVGAFRKVLDRGKREGVFRPTIDSSECWIIIVSACQFWWNQRYSLSAVLEMEVAAPQQVNLRRDHLADFVVAACLASDSIR